MPAALPHALALPVPVLVIASVAIVSVLGWLIAPLKRAFILSPYDVRRGGVHRLLTSGWLHVDITHLAFNMITLYFFADQVTRVLGETRFLVLYVSAVVVASIPSTLRHMGDRGYRSLGASGAVAAVMFSAILLHPKLKLHLMFVPIPVPALVFAIGYLAYSAYRSYAANSNVNHDAHFAGAFYGALFTYALEPDRVQRALKTLF